MPVLLSGYIVRRLVTSIALTFLIIFSLIVLIDFVEMIQDLDSKSQATVFDVVLITLQRAPVISEQVFPFVVLFASIAAFISLSRKMELVVARATGVSVWQILAPALLSAAVLGILVTGAYNPVSAYLKERATEQESTVLGKSKSRKSIRWIRQQSNEDQSVLRAERSSDRGAKLTGITAIVFTLEGSFQERIDAAAAVLNPGYWELQSARVQRQGSPPATFESYHLATNLTREQVAESITAPETISFWELPEVITLWEKAGLEAGRFKLQYQALLARPALYVAMVLIAAAVSLGLARLGGVSRAILGGVLAGFVLYVSSEMAGDLGAAGFITPVVAAWAPPIAGVLLSVTVLLFQEDG